MVLCHPEFLVQIQPPQHYEKETNKKQTQVFTPICTTCWYPLKKTSANSTSIPGVYIHLYRVFISTSNKHHQISTSIPGVPFWKTTSSTSTPGVCISIATLLLRVAAVIASHVARWSLPDDAQPHGKTKKSLNGTNLVENIWWNQDRTYVEIWGWCTD